MPATLKDILDIKLQTEMHEPSQLFSQSFIEDIYSILTLNEWSDERLLRLIEVPNLLTTLAHALHVDDLFAEFFERRVRELVLGLG
ncbi:MAG: hypothetical protein FWE28_00795 [Oscillospiraceae bacterium]|nr:hypothetical protein [Oscillospiraceae bacterium]